MEAMWDAVGTQDDDVGGQSVVDSSSECVGWQRGPDLEVGDLRQRVDPGIGPARSVELEVVGPGRLPDGALDFALHGPRILLNLPAAVARPGIFDGELQSHRLPASSLH